MQTLIPSPVSPFFRQINSSVLSSLYNDEVSEQFQGRNCIFIEPQVQFIQETIRSSFVTEDRIPAHLF